MSGQVRKISPPPGFDPRTIKPLASRRDWLGSLKKGEGLQDPEPDGKIIMNGTLRFVGWKDADWINLA